MSFLEQAASVNPELRSKRDRRRSVLLFGEMLADVFPDKTVIGGAPYNVARHLAGFGERPVLVTRLGKDTLGDSMLQEMRAAGMKTIGIQLDKTHPTGKVEVELADGQHQFSVLPQRAYDYIHPAIVRLLALSLNPALVYFGTLAQRETVSAKALQALIRSTRSPKFLDINLRKPWYTPDIVRRSLQWADVVKLNDEELELLVKMFDFAPGNQREAAAHLLVQFDVREVIVTCGAQGAWQLNREGNCVVIEAPPLQMADPSHADTVGAGDGFAAVYLLGELRGWPVRETLWRAASFASALCAIRGAIPEQPDFYAKFEEAWTLNEQPE